MKSHVVSLRSLLTKEHLDALLISSVPSIIYLTNYAGFSKEEREAFILVTANTTYIITDRRYSDAVKKVLPQCTLIERSAQQPFREILKTLVTDHAIKRLGFEEHDMHVSEFLSFKKALKDLHVTFVPSHNGVTKLREIKTPEEITAIEAACALGDNAFSHALQKITPGMSEKELAWVIEMFIKQHGAELSFRTIVAFGENAAIPHHLTSDKTLAKHDLILIDMGVLLNNYCSDMTRTVFLGKASVEQKKMYHTVLEAQTKSIEYLSNYSSSGVKRSREVLFKDSSRIRSNNNAIKAAEVDTIARSHITSQGYPSIPHSLGHGTGIEVHEAPFLGPGSKDILKPNMVFSVEPGIYTPGFGGIRIEDLVVLENAGPRLLTKSAKELIELG